MANQEPQLSKNAEPEAITLSSAVSTAIGSIPRNLQTDTTLELFTPPPSHKTSGNSLAERSQTQVHDSSHSSLEQIKFSDTKVEEREHGQQLMDKYAPDKQANKELSTLSTNPEEKVPKVPIVSTSAASTDEKTTTNGRKSDNGFIFYKCRFCGLTYNYLTTLRAHERIHNIDEPYKCNRCSESFHYMCELEYHAKQHSDLKGYKCECGRTFHSYTDLLYHKHPDDKDVESFIVTAPIVVKSSPPIPESDFPIPRFIEQGFEPKHPLRVYSDIRINPYICQYCSKSYPDSRMLAYHMYGHRGEKIFNPRASRYLMARSENSYISPGI